MPTESETKVATKKTDAVAEQKPASAKKTFQQLVDSDQFKSQILMALPKHLTPERFIRVLNTAIIKTPQLLDCTQETMFRCIFDCAAVGLEIDGRRAALVPLRNRKKAGQPLEANLWLMYQGIAELVMRSGVASNIHCDLVCEEDVFDYDRGILNAHKVNYKKPRGEPYAVYCIIRMKDGSEKVEVMGKDEVKRIQNAAPGGEGDAWRNHPGEMWKKTVFKRAAKWVPLSAEIKNVLETEGGDDEPTDVTPKPSLASLIGAPGAGAAEMNAEGQIEKATADPAAGAAQEPAVEAPTYTPEQRKAALDAVQTAMLDNQVSEAKVMLYCHQNKLAGEGHDEVGALPTHVLEGLKVIVPTLKAPAK